MYYELQDILPVLGVHIDSQVVTCGSKHWPPANSKASGPKYKYTDQRRHHSDMITLPTISM